MEFNWKVFVIILGIFIVLFSIIFSIGSNNSNKNPSFIESFKTAWTKSGGKRQRHNKNKIRYLK